MIATQLLFFAGSCWSDPVVDCEAEYQEHCREAVAKEDAYAISQCLKNQIDKFSPDCQKQSKGFTQQYETLRRNCRDVYRKTCQWDIDKKPSEDVKEAQELFECVLAHWDEYPPRCQDFIRQSVPMFAAIEQDIDTELWKRERQKPMKIKVAGVTKTIKVEAQEGDIVWYEAELKKKKVLDEYEVCPELPKESGLEMETNENQGTCYYRVKAPWGGNLIKELMDSGLLAKIGYHGVQVPGGYFSGENLDVKKVIEKYLSNCPEEFGLEVVNDTFRNTQHVTCERIKKIFYCKKGYVEFGLSEGYLGCRRLAECAESGEGYVEFGNEKQCAVCYAGGWVDQDRTYPDTVCKVNVKNPEDETVCPEGIRKMNYPDVQVQAERYYKSCQVLWQKTYTLDGSLSRETHGLHVEHNLISGTFKEYYKNGAVKSEGTISYSRALEQKVYNEEGKLLRIYKIDGGWEEIIQH